MKKLPTFSSYPKVIRLLVSTGSLPNSKSYQVGGWSRPFPLKISMVVTVPWCSRVHEVLD